MSGPLPRVWAVSLQASWFEFIGTCSYHEANEVYEKYVMPLFSMEEHQVKAREFLISLLPRGAVAVEDIKREELAHYHSIIAIVIHRVIDTAYDDIVRMGSDTIKSLPAYFESLSNPIPSTTRTPRQQKAFHNISTLSRPNCTPLILHTTNSLSTY
eukprot:TRINITY_DN4169_c0_g2_i1.p1 TRINITY_DN4169_c0_g2~~TRINITY_DN4169_c0_g2_i1.p1  ORF type:complete len:156 (-),score=10.85 TRINITY_DN4169_c0_g2_i1:50-517(-)